MSSPFGQRAHERLESLLRKIARRTTLAPVKKLGPRGLPVSQWQLSVSFVSAQKMLQLNSTYRKKRAVTDILSFPTPKEIRQLGFLGELVICTPQLRAQAKECGHSVHDELDVLLVHGVLHLLGLDHEKSRVEDRRMARLEKRCLQALNANLDGLILRTSRF